MENDIAKEKKGIKGIVVFLLILLTIIIFVPVSFYFGMNYKKENVVDNNQTQENNTNIIEKNETDKVINNNEVDTVIPEIIFDGQDITKEVNGVQIKVENIDYGGGEHHPELTINNKTFNDIHGISSLILLKDIIVCNTVGSDGSASIQFFNLNGNLITSYTSEIMEEQIKIEHKIVDNKIVYTVGKEYVCAGDKSCLLEKFSEEYSHYDDIIKADIEFEYDGENTGKSFKVANIEYMEGKN